MGQETVMDALLVLIGVIITYAWGYWVGRNANPSITYTPLSQPIFNQQLFDVLPEEEKLEIARRYFNAGGILQIGDKK